MARQNSPTSVSQPTISGVVHDDTKVILKPTHIETTHIETTHIETTHIETTIPRSTSSTIDSEDIEVLFLDHALWALLQIVHHVEAPIYDVRRERKLRHSSFSAAWTWSSNGIVIQEKSINDRPAYIWVAILIPLP
ncbi:hypothetical protein BYT27DRAFT_7191442 [Phlegmacium glaucopus]|nr:hypothetical protein BYT27DRAFT_7191442 [Phlegmacium glaucopus]